MQPWQNLGFTPPELLVPLARAAERAGMAGVSLPEHMVTPARIDTPNPYVPTGGAGYTADTPFVDPFIAFGAMASVTERLRFLANVYVLPLRSLFVAAKSISSTAVMSGGRLVLGIGIGWLREEFDAVGAEFGSRGRRTDEMLPLLEALLRGETVESQSGSLRFAPVSIAPVDARPVPIVVGGISDAALARAARADGWIGVNFTEDVLAPIIARLDRVRPHDRPFEIVVSRPPDFDRAMAERYARMRVTAVVNRPTVLSVGADAPLDAHEAAMREFVSIVAPAL